MSSLLDVQSTKRSKENQGLCTKGVGLGLLGIFAKSTVSPPFTQFQNFVSSVPTFSDEEKALRVWI